MGSTPASRFAVFAVNPGKLLATEIASAAVEHCRARVLNLTGSFELLHKLHDGAEDLLRTDIDDTSKSLATFFRVVMNITARARYSATDDVALVLMAPFVPIVSRQE